jgi:hypothetical protein
MQSTEQAKRRDVHAVARIFNRDTAAILLVLIAFDPE